MKLKNRCEKISKWVFALFGVKRQNKTIESFDVSEGFNEEMKQQIINSAITTCSHIMISAVVMTNSQELITGKLEFQDGSVWKLTWEKVLPSTPEVK